MHGRPRTRRICSPPAPASVEGGREGRMGDWPRRQEGEGDISEEGEGRGWVTGLPGVWGQYRQLLVLIERLSPLAGNPARPIYVWGEEGTRLGEAPPYTYGIVDSSDGCAEGPM